MVKQLYKMQKFLILSRVEFFIKVLSISILLVPSCDNDKTKEKIIKSPPPAISMDSSLVRTWMWDTITIPPYTYPEATAFGNGLYINHAYDTMGITIEGDRIRYNLNPINPSPPSDTLSPNNYRSEIRTVPWQINHPLGTEQWIGWRYYFPENYVIDSTSPITIYQNHPGIRGESPMVELEIAAHHRPFPAKGGEIQVVNVLDRIVYPVRPMAGDSLDIVIHAIWGLEGEGVMQIWLNHELYHDKQERTVYEDYPWGGNNKWGIYHHTFYYSPEDVQSSIDAGAGFVELFMGPLRLMTRTPNHPEYKLDAYHLVDPRQQH